MMVMARDSDYPELLESVKGKRVLIWTCDTCARLCGGMGGRDAAARLSERLSADGVEVCGVAHTSASCLMGKVRANMPEGGHDTVLALTCDVGASCAGRVSGVPVVNPVVTFGSGYLDDSGSPRITSILCGSTVVDEPLSEAASRTGALMGPFI